LPVQHARVGRDPARTCTDATKNGALSFEPAERQNARRGRGDFGVRAERRKTSRKVNFCVFDHVFAQRHALTLLAEFSFARHLGAQVRRFVGGRLSPSCSRCPENGVVRRERTTPFSGQALA